MQRKRGVELTLQSSVVALAIAVAGTADGRRSPTHQPAAAVQAQPSLAEGLALLKQGKAANAAKAFRSALSAAPELKDHALYYLGEALFAQERFRQAAAAFGQAAKTTPSRFVDLGEERRADAMRRAGQSLAAAAAYRKLLKGYPEHPERARVTLALALALKDARRLREAADELQKVFLEWPALPEADRAKELLDELAARGLKVAPVTVDQAIARARLLRRVKEFDEAIAELQALRARNPEAADRIDVQLVYAYRKAERPAEALAIVKRLVERADSRAGKRGGQPRLLRLHAELLAWTGRVQEAAALALGSVPEPPRRQHRPALALAVKLLAEHAQYAAALRQAERLAAISGPRSDQLRLAWLAYRAGQYDLAIERFRRLPRRERGLPFSLYWQARAQAKVGRTELAVTIYRQLLEQHLRSYHGQLARSRLAEMGKLTLEPRSCAPVARAPQGDFGLALATLDRRYGQLLPLLKRAATLERYGLTSEMRRELNVAAMDFTYALYRGRKRQFNVRADVARLWRGGDQRGPRFRLSPITRQLRRLTREEQLELRQTFGALLRQAGVFYFGWRLDKPDANVTRHQYPQAYFDVVASAAHHEDLDPNLIWSIMRKESAYRADAISRVRAGGLMQLMPHTATRLAAEKGIDGFSFARVFEPRINVSLAAHYLRALHHKFSGQLPLIAAAYNGGPHNIARWLTFRGEVSTMDEFIEEIPFRESRRYAQKVLLLLSQYERTYCDKDDRLIPNTLNPRFNEYPAY